MSVEDKPVPRGAVLHSVKQAGREVPLSNKGRNIASRLGILGRLVTVLSLAACSRYPVLGRGIEEGKELNTTPTPIVEQLPSSQIPTPTSTLTSNFTPFTPESIPSLTLSPTPTPTPPETLTSTPTPTQTETSVLQILPEDQEIKGIIEETISLKELERQGYWLFYYDPDEQIFKRLAYTSRKYTIDANGYWHYTLVSNPKKENVRVIKREDGSIIGINNNGDKVEAVAIKDIIDSFGGEGNVSDPIRVSTAGIIYFNRRLPKGEEEYLDLPAFFPSEFNSVEVGDYNLEMIEVLIPNFYPVKQGERIVLEQYLVPYWVVYDIRDKAGKSVLQIEESDSLLLSYCSSPDGPCNLKKAKEIFNLLEDNQKFFLLTIILPTRTTLESVRDSYPNFGEVMTVLQKAYESGIINTQGAEELKRISKAIEERMRDAQSKGKDPFTDLARLSLDNRSISLNDNSIKLPVTLPKSYTVIGILLQVQVGNLY